MITGKKNLVLNSQMHPIPIHTYNLILNCICEIFWVYFVKTTLQRHTLTFDVHWAQRRMCIIWRGGINFKFDWSFFLSQTISFWKNGEKLACNRFNFLLLDLLPPPPPGEWPTPCRWPPGENVNYGPTQSWPPAENVNYGPPFRLYLPIL